MVVKRSNDSSFKGSNAAGRREGDYVPVLVSGVIPETALPLDLYVKADENYFKIKNSGEEYLPHLSTKYAKSFLHYYIPINQSEKYFSSLQGYTTNIIKNPAVPLKTKAAVLADCAVGIVDELYKDPYSAKSMNASKQLTQDMLTFINQHPQAFLHLVELSDHDHYTYAHSVGVAAYSMAMARALPDRSEQQVIDIGLAGMLHDLGKCMVDPGIINKQGPLNADEWSIMKKHPAYGKEILGRHKNISQLIIVAAEGHHEALDGSGYPRGKHAIDIAESVRIVTLADAFSALTTKRSYSEPRDAFSALNLLKDNLGRKFDTDVFKQFVILFTSQQQAQKLAA